MTVLASLREPRLEATRTAFAFQGVRLSRGELFGRAQQLAQAMQAYGLRPGDRVGLLMANPAIHVTCLLGLSQVGAVGVAVQASWLQQVGSGPLARLGLTWLVHDRRDAARLPVPSGCQVVSAREVFAPASAERSVTPVHPAFGSGVDLSKPWLLSMSSGTTGEPKCVVTSQSAFMASLQMGEQFQAEDRVFLFLEHSMYWAFATACRAIMAGAQAVFQPPSILPAQLLQMLHDAQATVLVLSVDAASKVANYLLDFPGQSPSLRLSRVIVGGGRVSARVLQVLREQWGARVVVLYGSTEMGPMAVWRQNAEEGDHEGANHLAIFEGVQAQVVDGLAHALPRMEVGFLRLRSAAMFSGYLDENGQLPEQAPEWFYPGDLACITSEGHIELHGRADHVLNLGGLKVDPERIEQTMALHKGVADVALTVATMGAAEVPVLVGVVVLKPGHAVDALRDHCARHLPAAHCPAYWLSVPALPRNVAGKLQRQAVASMVRIEPNS
jgi:acyl-coenzyme A synthetase/AMP-(fatty) acid ligase